MNTLVVKNAEITKLENQLEALTREVEGLKKTKELVQGEIDKKMADFTVYISQRDSENKMDHAKVLEEKEKLNSERTDFQQILTKHKQDKQDLESQKKEFEIQRMRESSKIANVQEFVTAVRRAYSLLNI